MIKRITIRLDDDLSTILAKIKNKDIYNLSALIREALRDKLRAFSSIDNSGKGRRL